MKSGSKRGAALAYVIVITAVLMILASALIFTAKFNIDYTQNSLESRQAYLDAKSAIEYGKAYLAKNPGSADFTVDLLSGTGTFKIKTESEAVVNAIAAYTKSTHTINAAGKYKSTDRVRRLGYKMTATSGTSGAGQYSFLAAGTQYGSQNGVQYLFHDNGDYVGQGSEFPIVAKKSVIFQGTQTMTAPEIVFIGRKTEMGANDCLFSNNWGNSTTLKADFIGFDGDIVGKAYTQSGQQIQQPKLFIQTESDSTKVIVHFARKLKIEFVDPNNTIITAYSGANPVEFEAGYYSFPTGTNLFDLASVKGKATKLSDAEVKGVHDQFQTTQFSNDDVSKLISSEEVIPTRWTSDGKMENTTPSTITTENATVFLCASQFNYQNLNQVVFEAPNIVFQWNSGANLAVSFNSMSSSVTFKAKSISINLHNTYGNPPIVQSNPNSHFYLAHTSSVSPVITFITDTVIKTTKKTSTITKGVYNIGSDNKVGGRPNAFKVDLFDAGMVLDRVSNVGGGSGGGTDGDVVVSGGVYTNG